jgi:hypothetical protein
MSVKKALCGAFMGMGVVLETEAVALLISFVESHGDIEDAIRSIVGAVETGDKTCDTLRL